MHTCFLEQTVPQVYEKAPAPVVKSFLFRVGWLSAQPHSAVSATQYHVEVHLHPEEITLTMPGSHQASFARDKLVKRSIKCVHHSFTTWIRQKNRSGCRQWSTQSAGLGVGVCSAWSGLGSAPCGAQLQCHLPHLCRESLQVSSQVWFPSHFWCCCA